MADYLKPSLAVPMIAESIVQYKDSGYAYPISISQNNVLLWPIDGEEKMTLNPFKSIFCVKG
jgi:hypothetical protein